MKNLISSAALALCLPTVALATDVNLSIESAGANTIQTVVGVPVDYAIYLELSDGANEGLALCCFDLAFDGGPLSQANTALTPEQLNFASPLGLSNPAGFGGTPDAGKLLQVGGGQNTIKNTFAAQPTGSVIVDLAKPGTRLLFATGQLTAPTTAGTYHLDASNLIANVVRQGETGTGAFWAVDAAQPGTVTGLTIQVTDCTPIVYCSPKVNSQGCTPAIAVTGTPALSSPNNLHVKASNVLNQKFGQMFWGRSPANTPFQGGTMCISGTKHRTTMQQSGGSASGEDCTGVYDFHFSHAYMAGAGLGVGDTIYAQYWYRDNNNIDGTGFGLSDAAEFTLCP